MSNDVAARFDDLRATLERSGITLDDVPRIEACDSTHEGNHCMRCEVARRDTLGLWSGVISDAVMAFEMYPPPLLAATNLQHVALCRTIEVEDGHIGAAGMAIPSQNRILLNIEAFRTISNDMIDRVIHHELFHLFDREHLSGDLEWTALNPPGFAYHDPDMQYRTRAIGTTRPAGFVEPYGTQNEAEDRATTFDLMLARPKELCEIAAKDPIVAKKAALIKKRVRRVAGNTPLIAPCATLLGRRSG